MRTPFFHQRSGATLIEVIAGIVVLGIIVTIIITIFTKTVSYSSDEQTRIAVGDAASKFFPNLDKALRQGRSVLASTTVSGTTYTTSETTLVLAIPAVVNGLPTVNDDIFIIYLDSTNRRLQERIIPYVDASNSAENSSRLAGTTLLTTDVESVYFRYTTEDPIDSETVTATVTTQKTINNAPFTQAAILYATLRNHQ